MKDWLDDLRIAVGMLTRVPVPHPDGASPAYFSRASRMFPVVGAAVGGVVGVVDLALLAAGLPPLAAAALALGAGALITGALHEDGLGDLADGFGGGRDKAAKLAIMRDSRIGTYGTLILLVGFTAKLAALAALPPAAVLPSLIAAHALARGVLPTLACTMAYARDDGLASRAGRPEPRIAATAALIALTIALAALPWPQALACTLAAALGAATIAFIAHRQIGGQTGDVLGGAEQVAEIAVLLIVSRAVAT